MTLTHMADLQGDIRLGLMAVAAAACTGLRYTADGCEQEVEYEGQTYTIKVTPKREK